MFKRDISAALQRWAERPDRKPLVLRGARQVGKTTVVNQFGASFDKYLYINLEDRNAARLFETSHPISDIITDLFAYKGIEKGDGRTLLFIDEIQNSPEAVALLRYFYEDAPWLYVIAAGSLLENLIDRHITFPVGRVEYMAVRPCSFREFMTAMGKSALRERISSSPENSIAFHDMLIAMFNRYTLIGGMPEIVDAYTRNNDIVAMQHIYESLLQGYRDDSEKYASNRTQREVISLILQYGWGEAGKAITLGGFANSPYKARETGEALRTLEKAMLLELVYPTTSTTVPLIPDTKRSPKLIWFDTGLVNYAASIQKEVFGAMDIMDAWRGMIAEQIVAQELLSLSTNVSERRNFWIRNKPGSNAEVDFMLMHNSVPVPIEVKSGHNAKLRSLHSFVDNSDCSIAVRIWSQPYSEDIATTANGKTFTLLNIPFYLIGFLPSILDKYIPAPFQP